ncbi:hypothetical protein EVAR_10566_1 [Eumeta japonica]|uniref:Uncharacterized protein n=1 Tax=Eumeta variegata TaxID=151549 RepID=A0A4C1U1S5_EUMVA|nr:hypothetical protein EVAR_10566_1 [Eumeta japonica]
MADLGDFGSRSVPKNRDAESQGWLGQPHGSFRLTEWPLSALPAGVLCAPPLRRLRPLEGWGRCRLQRPREEFAAISFRDFAVHAVAMWLQSYSNWKVASSYMKTSAFAQVA